MFDIGWTEMFMVIVVAVIVIGPKDLPRTLRTVGQWVGKVRSMGRDFQRGLDDMIRETELDEVKKQIETTAKIDLKKEIEETVDPTGSIKEAMKPVDLTGKTPSTAIDSGAEQKATEKSPERETHASAPDTPPPAKTGT